LKLPICSFDAKSGILCPRCEAKLKAGHITNNDVEASIKLTKIADSHPLISKVTLHKAVKVDEDFVLVVNASDAVMLRRDSTAISKVKEALGCERVWIVESDASNRKLLEDLFHPVRLLTVNVVYLPDGSVLTKVIVPRRVRYMPDIEKIKKIVKELRGIELLVEQEHFAPYAKFGKR
jgi:transcription antitermination factor NusA-like protein